MPPLRRRLALSAAALLVGLAGVEAGSRVWLAARGKGYSPAAVRRALDQTRARVVEALPRPAGEDDGLGDGDGRNAPLALVPHPYVGFELDRGARQIENDQERIARAGADPFAILLTGGSVAGIFAGVGMRRLIELLEADERFAGRRVLALNHGRAAWKQPQQTALLVHLLGLGLEPDLVLNLDGFNELAVAATNARFGAHPSYPALAQWRRVSTAVDSGADALARLEALLARRAELLVAVERFRGSALLHSAVIGQLALGDVRAREERYVMALEAYSTRPPAEGLEEVALFGPAAPAEPAETLALSVRGWREGSRSMHALCERRGIAYLHVLQPTLLDAGSKPLSAEERERGVVRSEWVQAVSAGYPLLRAAGAELAAEGVPFLDASDVFAEIEDELYYDACHFDEQGNLLLAEEIARALLASEVGR